MPSRLAASMMVELAGTSMGLPSISMFGIEAISSFSSVDRLVHQAALVLDVVFELVAKMLDEAFHRQRGGIAQCTDGASGDVVADGHQRVEVFLGALAVLDPVHHAVQ